MEATSLIVEQANDIIRDAKSIINGDAYLDRVKEFVPAGNNPVYPDVLMVARSVQQCLGRTEKQLSDRERRTTKMRRDARTIVAALRFFAEHNKHPSREDVEALLETKPPDDWFFQSSDETFYFDFERLDRNGVGRSLAAADLTGSQMQHTTNLHALLLQGISQYDVDFVIPRTGVDIPVGIDPFSSIRAGTPSTGNAMTLCWPPSTAGLRRFGAALWLEHQHFLIFQKWRRSDSVTRKAASADQVSGLICAH